MFETEFGRGIAGKLFKSLANKKVLLISQKNLVEKYKDIIPDSFIVECIDNIEEANMRELNESLPETEFVIGFGGGLSIDGAKYFAWQRDIPCYSVLTAISVDACYSYPIALRRNSVVCYEGVVLPEKVIADYDIIRSAPKSLNLSGVGDVLSCYTGLFDWTLMDMAKAGPPVVKEQYDTAEKILDSIFFNVEDIREMTDNGIQIVMSGYKWVGIEGYNCRYCHFEEGSEHYLAYTIESICGKHLLHGQLVCMCVYIMSKLQQEGRQKKIAELMASIGLSIKPEDVGLTYEEVICALERVNDFACEKGLPYSVLNEKKVTAEFIEEVIGELKSL